MFEVGTGSLLSSEELKNGKIPRISAKSENNGILGYFSSENLANARHFENFISVNFFGADGGIFYHPYKASVEMKVHTLKIPNREFSAKTGNFIASALKLSLRGFGYGNQLSSSKLKDSNFKIQLPTKNGEIDFGFMEELVGRIESDKIAKLDAYLVATGLKDYVLTVEEQQLLNNVEGGGSTIKFGEFRISDLFEINSSAKRFDANKVIIGEIGKPYVVRTALNNGIRGFINEDDEYLNEGNTIAFGQDTATMFYQEKRYFTGDKIKIIKSKNNKLNKINAHFFITMMTRSFSSFSWGGSSFNVNIIGNQTIQLPITDNNQPDYQLMDTLMSAIQKLVIKGVVEWIYTK